MDNDERRERRDKSLLDSSPSLRAVAPRILQKTQEEQRVDSKFRSARYLRAHRTLEPEEAAKKSLNCPLCDQSIPRGKVLFYRFWSHVETRHYLKLNEIPEGMERRMWVRRLWNTAVKTNMARSPTETKAPREDNTKNLVANRATGPASTSIIGVTRSLQDPPPYAFAAGLREPTAQPRTSFPTTTIRDRRVPGRVNGIKIDALPDTGAEASFISESFLRKLHLDGKEGYDKDAPIWSVEYHVPISPPVQLASGKTVTPTTMALIPWRFEGESQVHNLACLVLPKCAHDLILGDSFLRMTETLTKFKTRIVMTLRSLGSRLLRLNYMGSGLEPAARERRRMWGSLDGEAVAALPDSGSDIMAVSAEYARRRGWRVDRGREKRVEVEFADGSTAWTKGVVSGLEWEFGGTGGKVRSDFYVLEGLPVDVVFSSDFVFDHDVYGRHEQSIRRYGELLDVLRLCNIRLIGECKKQGQAEEEGIVDMTSPDAFSSPMVHRELARRDAIADAIAALPVAEQAFAQQAEAERQRLWENFKAEHGRRWANSTPPEPASEPDTADSQGSGTGRSRLSWAAKWARRNLKAVSVPLVPLRKRVPAPGEV